MSTATTTPVQEVRDILTDLLHHAYSNKVSVTIKEATEMMGFSNERYVRKLIEAGDLRARKVRDSKIILVSVQSIHEYIGDK